MLLRRALIGAAFMLAAGLAVVVVVMTLPRWVLTVVITSPRDMLQKRVTVDEAVAAPMAAICLEDNGRPAHTVQNERPSSPPVPNDRWLADWRAFQIGRAHV